MCDLPKFGDPELRGVRLDLWLGFMFLGNIFEVEPPPKGRPAGPANPTLASAAVRLRRP